MILTPIADRISEALATGPLPYVDLARRVFPPLEMPRAWRYASQGGPPGCYMALSSAIRRHGFRTWYDRHNRQMVGLP